MPKLSLQMLSYITKKWEILYIPEIRGPFDLTQKAYTAMMTPGKFHVHENSQMVIYISAPAKVDTHPVL